MKDETFRPNRVLSYFQEEWKILFFVTVSGLIYNLGPVSYTHLTLPTILLV